MRYTIEARELTNGYTHRPAHDVEARLTTVEAGDAGEALSQFVRQSDAELVSLHSPRGTESIATVKKEDTVFLIRVYEV